MNIEVGKYIILHSTDPLPDEDFFVTVFLDLFNFETGDFVSSSSFNIALGQSGNYLATFLMPNNIVVATYKYYSDAERQNLHPRINTASETFYPTTQASTAPTGEVTNNISSVIVPQNISLLTNGDSSGLITVYKNYTKKIIFRLRKPNGEVPLLKEDFNFEKYNFKICIGNLIFDSDGETSETLKIENPVFNEFSLVLDSSVTGNLSTQQIRAKCTIVLKDNLMGSDPIVLGFNLQTEETC